jgi:hypothetical protein
VAAELTTAAALAPPPATRPAEAASQLSSPEQERIAHLPIDDRFALAEAYQSRGRHVASRQILYRIAREPRQRGERVRAFTLAAESWAAQGDHVHAAGAYMDAVRAGGRSVEAQNAQFALAMLREQRMNDITGALAAYEKLLEMAPNGPNAASARAAVRRIWTECRRDDTRCP